LNVAESQLKENETRELGMEVKNMRVKNMRVKNREIKIKVPYLLLLSVALIGTAQTSLAQTSLVQTSLAQTSLAQTNLAQANSVKEKSFYGQQISLKKSVELSTVISQSSKFKGKEILIKAKVEKVCEKKGCWMALSADGKTVRVTFKDYGFFVPSYLQGKTIMAQGKFKLKILSQREARHFAEDAGKSKAEIQAIKGEQKEYRFVASGVQLASQLK